MTDINKMETAEYEALCGAVVENFGTFLGEYLAVTKQGISTNELVMVAASIPLTVITALRDTLDNPVEVSELSDIWESLGPASGNVKHAEVREH